MRCNSAHYTHLQIPNLWNLSFSPNKPAYIVRPTCKTRIYIVSLIKGRMLECIYYYIIASAAKQNQMWVQHRHYTLEHIWRGKLDLRNLAILFLASSFKLSSFKKFRLCSFFNFAFFNANLSFLPKDNIEHQKSLFKEKNNNNKKP